MTTLEITNKAGKVKLNLEDKASEITLQRYIDYSWGIKNWLSFIDKDSNKVICFESIDKLVTILSDYFRVSKKELVGLEIEPEGFINFLDRNKKRLKLTSSLLSILNYIDQTIKDAKPNTKYDETYSFFYKGEEFIVPYNLSVDFVLSKRPKPTYGEIMEILEIKRVLLNRYEIKDEAGKELGDPDGSLYFEEALRIVAILARKKDEPLPLNDTDNWLRDRAVFFKDISLQVWLDIYFFLTSIGEVLGKTNNFSISSNLLPPLLETRSNQN